MVHPRFDGDVVNPFDSAVLCGVSSEAAVLSNSLTTYNNAGDGVTGYHSDPMFAADRPLRAQLPLARGHGSKERYGRRDSVLNHPRCDWGVGLIGIALSRLFGIDRACG